jgi:hypothetical protein
VRIAVAFFAMLVTAFVVVLGEGLAAGECASDDRGRRQGRQRAFDLAGHRWMLRHSPFNAKP